MISIVRHWRNMKVIGKIGKPNNLQILGVGKPETK